MSLCFLRWIIQLALTLYKRKLLDLKAFEDDKINMTQKLKLALGREENIFPAVFSKGYFLRAVENQDCVVKG